MEKIIQNLSRPEHFRKLSTINKAIVREYKKDLRKWKSIPPSFIAEYSKLITLSFRAWEKAREKEYFRIFVSYLEKVVQMKQKEAHLINPQGHPYEVLIDDFEEGMTIKNWT